MQVVVMIAVAALAAAPVPPEAQQAKDQAEALKKQGDLSGAEAAYKRAIGLFPAFALAHNDYGSLLFEQGRVLDAIDQFELATKTDPDYAIAWFNLGFASRKTGNFAKAVDAYRKYTALKPDDTDGWYGLGEACRNAGQKDCAVQGYQTYIAKEHRSSEQKWLDKAKGYLAELQPAAAPAQGGNTGAVVGGVGSTGAPAAPMPVPATPAPAVTAVPSPIPATSSPTSQARLQQGDTLFGQKQYKEALFAYQDAVNADPANLEALFDLGKTYAVMGYYKQAIDRWQRVVDLATDPGVKQRAQENIDRAKEKLGQAGSPPAATQASTTAPSAPGGDLARARYEEGVSLINQRNYAQAIDALNASLAANPNYALAVAARGSAHVGLRQYPEAVEDYQAALRMDPNMATPLFGAAEAYRAMGRKQDAALYYQRYADSHAPDISPQLQDEARRRATELSQ